jgi:aarF domain-containing kinase
MFMRSSLRSKSKRAACLPVCRTAIETPRRHAEYMDLDSDPTRRGAVADIGSHCMLTMMLVHNLIHSDLHPGNILVRWQLPDGWLVRAAAAVVRRTDAMPAASAALLQSWLRPHIVLLDVGMATELSAADQRNMLALFKSFVEVDGERMAACTLAFAGAEQRCPDHAAFQAAIRRCAFLRLERPQLAIAACGGPPWWIVTP